MRAFSNSPAHKAAQRPEARAAQLAHDAIRSLLNGSAPPALAPAVPNTYGRWTATLEQLFAAHQAGGTPAVAQAYQELHRADDQLIALMGSGGKLDGRGTQQIITLEELLAAELPVVEYFIEYLLRVGVTGISGRPKVGKSWLVEDMALALSSGGEVLGFQARKVHVLYLAMEDSPGRLQNRSVKLRAQPNQNLRIAFAWKPLADGGMQDLETAVVDGGYQVIIIDTFSRVSGRADQMDPNEMTAIFAALQQMALKHNIAIVVVDHHRKAARQAVDGDPIDDIFGSTAKASVLDCATGLYRKHNSNDAVLKLVGRDFGDAEYALTWDPDHFTWQRKEEAKQGAKETRTTSIYDRLHVDEILEALDALGHCTLARLATLVKIDKSNLLDLLIAMVEGGLIRRNTDGGSITYALVVQAAEQANAGAGTRSARSAGVLACSPPDLAPPQSLRKTPAADIVNTMGTTHTTRTTDTMRTRSSPPTRPKTYQYTTRSLCTPISWSSSAATPNSAAAPPPTAANTPAPAHSAAATSTATPSTTSATATASATAKPATAWAWNRDDHGETSRKRPGRATCPTQ